MSVDFRSASLSHLAFNDEFVQRHIGPDAQQTAAMLATLGVASVKELIDKTVPEKIRLKGEMALGEAVTETAALAELKAIASKNRIFKSYIGMGYHDTHVPHVVLRNGKSRLVYGLHPLSARNCSGPFGSAAELPANDY
jgi:glycine dehydrogenase